MGYPFFSIMMPAYNAENYIQLALESILSQTYKDYEVIVLDDGSSDKTLSIANNYANKDHRIKVYQNQENMGNCYTRRLALEKMTGKYVAFLDSDDIWLPEKLECFKEKIAEVGARSLCIHSDAIIIDAEGDDTGELFQDKLNSKRMPVEGFLLHELLLTNWINMSSAVVDRETLVRIGGFRPLHDMVADDWDMWVRFAEEGEFFFIPQALTKYRIHSAGISAPHKVRRVAHAREQIFENVIKLYQDKIPKKLLSKVCYLRAANASVLEYKWLCRKYFFEAWVYNKLNYKALIRTVLGR